MKAPPFYWHRTAEDYCCRTCNYIAEVQDGILTCPKCGAVDSETMKLLEARA